MLDLEQIFGIVRPLSTREAAMRTEGEWKSFKSQSTLNEWLYVYVFSAGSEGQALAWGTSSGNNDRIRKACLLNPKLTGKYDRRVDYLMLKIIHGMPLLHVFETRGKATHVELVLKRHFNQRHCYRGLPGADRLEISRGIFSNFKETTHFRTLEASDRSDFERYIFEVFFASRVHPENPRRTFKWGDSLEPGFLPMIGLSELQPAIQRALGVRF